MKTTLPTLLAVSLCSVVWGSTMTFQLGTPGGTYYAYSGAPRASVTTGVETVPNVGTITLPEAFAQDGTSAKLIATSGASPIWFTTPSTTTADWTNSGALDEFNTFAGTNVEAANLYGKQYVGSSNSDSKAALSLTLGSNYRAGDQVMFYAIMASPSSSVSSVTVTGLSGATVSYASNNGTTFAGSINSNRPFIVKCTGTLVESNGETVITLQGNAAKTSFSAFSLATTLTATSVTSVDSFENGVLTLTVDRSLSGVTNTIGVTVGDAMWNAIVEKMGNVYQSAGITLVDADGTSIALGTGTDVKFNGYAGEADGKYFVAYIPEPATATLSLLVLAGLAARRRRK